jgi:hypothetical protein
MREQSVIDFAWRNLLATTHDQFLDATDEKEVSFLVEASLVARVKPSVAKRLLVRDGIIVVSLVTLRPRITTSPTAPLDKSAPASFITATSTPVGHPTDPGFRGDGGSLLHVIW